MTIRKIIERNKENLTAAFVGLVCWPALVGLIVFHFMFSYGEKQYQEGKEKGYFEAVKDMEEK